MIPLAKALQGGANRGRGLKCMCPGLTYAPQQQAAPSLIHGATLLRACISVGVAPCAPAPLKSLPPFRLQHALSPSPPPSSRPSNKHFTLSLSAPVRLPSLTPSLPRPPPPRHPRTGRIHHQLTIMSRSVSSSSSASTNLCSKLCVTWADVTPTHQRTACDAELGAQ